MPQHLPSRTPLALRPLGVAQCRLRERAARGLVWASPPPAWQHIAVHLCDPPQAAPQAHRDARLRIALDEGWLELDDPGLLEIASGVPLGSWAQPAHAQAALRLACARVDEALCEALGGLLQVSWQPAGADPDDVGPLARLRITLVAEQSGERFRFAVSAPVDAALKWLQDARWRMQRGAGVIDLDGLPLSCEVQLGGARLGLAQLRQLRPGDAVLTQWPSADAARQARLRLGNGWLPVQAVAGGWQVLAKENGDEWMEMIDHGLQAPDLADHAHDGAVPEGSLDELPVTLTFVAARLQLALGQVRALVPGCVIPTDETADASVRILANGVEIGRGDLVEVAGRLAVEVTQLRSPS